MVLLTQRCLHNYNVCHLMCLLALLATNKVATGKKALGFCQELQTASKFTKTTAQKKGKHTFKSVVYMVNDALDLAFSVQYALEPQLPSRNTVKNVIRLAEMLFL